MRVPWKPPSIAAILVCVAISRSKLVNGKINNNSLGIAEFIKEAVFGGSHDEEKIYAQGRITPRLSTPSYQNQKLLQNKFSSIQRDNVELSAHRTLAEQIMTALEVPPATRTLGTDGNPARFCLVGSCCGWGHRLVRQAKVFTYLHYLENATIIMGWGSCPNEQGHTDFSSVMIDDSPTLASVQTKVCQTAPNSDCMKCGGHEIDPARWEETLEYFGEDMRNITGRTGSIQNSAGIFFEPFQFFIRSILTQLKSNIKNQISDFLTEHFSGQPVISVHHRHGNGELDDFTNKETGAPAGRLNKNNTKVIQWMQESVSELAAAYGIKNYKIFFATDSPEMTRMFMALDSRVFVYNQMAKEELEGKGFVMPGWQGWGRSPGLSTTEKGTLCEDETTRAFIDMVLLGYTDMLVVSKRSTFTFAPSVMMAARQKPVCTLVDGRKEATSFTCRSSQEGERAGLVVRST